MFALRTSCCARTRESFFSFSGASYYIKALKEFYWKKRDIINGFDFGAFDPQIFYKFPVNVTVLSLFSEYLQSEFFELERILY